MGQVSSRELHDADPASFPWGNFRVAVVNSVIELVEALRVVAVLAPITRPREEAVFAFGCADDDPHGELSLTFSFLCSNSGVPKRQQLLPSAESSVLACGTHIHGMGTCLPVSRRGLALHQT